MNTFLSRLWLLFGVGVGLTSLCSCLTLNLVHIPWDSDVVPSSKRCVTPQTPHFVLFVTVWKRLELTQLVLEHYVQVQYKFSSFGTISIWLVGSEGEASQSLVKNLTGIYYVECPNFPVSDKHNCGLQKLGNSQLASKVDGIVVVGSDDFCEDAMFMLYRKLYCEHFPRVHFMGLTDYLILNLQNWQLQRFYFCEKNIIGSYFGVGRFLSSSLLHSMNWTIWEPGLFQGLDQSMTRSLWRKFPLLDKVSLLISPMEYDFSVVDVKSEESGIKNATNMWSFNDMIDKTQSNNNLSYCSETVSEPNKFYRRFQNTLHQPLDEALQKLLLNKKQQEKNNDHEEL